MQDLMRTISKSYENFSAGQKKVGDLFIEEPIFLAFSSALEVGRKVNVSESTVIRWAQKLGYRGYAEFQEVVQQKLAQERIEQNNADAAQQISNQSFLKNLLDSDIALLQQLKQQLDEEKLLQVVDGISQSKKLYITGNLFDYGMVHSFANWLNHTLNHTELLMPGDAHYYLQLSKLEEDNTVIAFSFPRYEKKVTETLETARRQGTNIIVIADSSKAPTLELADIFLQVPMSSNLGIDSYTAVHALMTSIMRFVYVKEHTKVKENLERIDAVYTEKDFHH